MNYNLAQNDLEKFVCLANHAVELKLVKNIEDLDNDSVAFNPEFTHQFFGDTEMIFGYKGLKIKMYYTASKLRLYFDIAFTEKVDLQGDAKDIQADDVVTIIKNRLELQNYFTNLDKFVQCLQDEHDFQPYGEKLHEFKTTDDRMFEIYFVDYKTPDFIQNYHEQMQHFLIWFIDGASYIDIDDDRWNYFVIYEKVKNINETYQHYFVGYSTVYCYYAYPDKIRPRISQVLVLPPYQKNNIGYHLLQTINKYYECNKNVLDITVEDPSDHFSQLRNYVDCQNCLKMATFSKEHLMTGWSKEMEDEARRVHKIHKLQSRKVYEILKLMNININNETEYKNYRLEVKARLAAPLLKTKKTTKFFGEKPNIDQTPREVVIAELSAAYSELEKEYLKTIQKLKLDI